MAAIAGSVVGVASSMKQVKEAKKIMREGQAGIDNFEWDELQNPYRNLAPSTAGADIRRDEAARMASTSTDALRNAGTRGIIGGIGRVQAANTEVARDTAANLDEQVRQIDMLAAQDDAKLREMQETRQTNELAGYGNMLDVGRDMKNKGNAAINSNLHALDEDIWSAAGAAATGGASKGAEGMMGMIGGMGKKSTEGSTTA